MATAAPKKIQIVCRCGLRDPDHEPWRLGFILETGDRSPVGAGCSMIRRDGDGAGTGYVLRCGHRGHCRRAPRLTFHRWRILVANLDEADVDTLDIAALRL